MSGKSERQQRINKGKSIIDFPEDFTIVDLETTGLSPSYDNIIEISAFRIRGGKVVDTFTSLVKPYFEIDPFITKLTGLTNDMFVDAPAPENILPIAREFIGDDIIIGHYVNFDINFLYDWFEYFEIKPLTNNFVDTLRIARKVFPELPHHRLEDIAIECGVNPDDAHRAEADCQTTFDCYCTMRDIVVSGIGVDDFIKSFKPKSYRQKSIKEITTENIIFDETHPLYGKHCVFTGTLERMTRQQAAQAVVDIGGICDNAITKKTNFLILGNTDYKKTGGQKSSKHRKAEQYKLSGIDIEILPENVFYDMLEE
jgi:DNA polymerase-3 subunit epsilon